MICPVCNKELKFEYVKTNHIGKIYCTDGHIKSPESKYIASNIDNKNCEIEVNGFKYHMISDTLFNQYNQVALIAFLTEIGIKPEAMNEAFKKMHIVNSRHSEYILKQNKKFILNLTKGQNSFACSNVFLYVKKYEGKKSIILILDDKGDNKEASETIMWHYDADWELLNDDSINQIIIGGPRSKDIYLRALLAGIDKDKISICNDPVDTYKYLDFENNDTFFLLYDIYAQKEAKEIRNNILDKYKNEEKEE